MNKLIFFSIFFSFYLILFQTAWVTAPTAEAASFGIKSPSQKISFSDNDQTCMPGEGTMWVNGPLDEQKAIEIQNVLNTQGILANVEARGYGEIDSCGAYFQKGFDFKVTLATNNNEAKTNPDVFQNNLDDIQSIVEANAGENLGNVLILDSAGNRLNSQSLLAAEIQTLESNSTSASTITKNVYVIVYNPMLANGQTLSQYMHWNDPSTITQQTIDFFQQASNGKLLYTIAYSSTVTSGWPELIDGYSYNETTYLQVIGNPTLHHTPTEVDYNKIFDNPVFDICGKVNRGEVDEVWIYGGPWFGFYESRLVGPNAYTFNSPPVNNSNCSKMVPVMGPSMERTTHEAVHNFTHRAEATMTKIYGGWAQNRTTHNWDRFGLVKAQSPNYSYSGCGSSHYPPNGVQDYDYANSTSALSNCEDFLNYPALSDPLQVAQPINCNIWGCNGLGYYDYWFSHFPSTDGCTEYVANDWWKYFADPANALLPASLCDVWIISGNAGVGGATLNYIDDKARTVTADNLGNYSIPVPYGWSGTITPVKANFTFSPIDLSFSNLASDLNEQDFIANTNCPSITDWKGEYWGNMTMTGAPSLCRNDTAINFLWGLGTPGPNISADYFSARWTRNLYFAPGLYRFKINHDDGARLYIDDVLQIDVMGTCCVWDQVDISLSGNHSIRMEMFENSGNATAQLEILPMNEPEIQVLGNNIVILDGDSSPSTTDHTNFGNISIYEGTLTRTFTIQNIGFVDLNLSGTPKVEISGSTSSDFTITTQPAGTISPSGSTTFTVLFDPSTSGLRTATLTIANNDTNENPYNFVLYGTGLVSPEIDVTGNNISIPNGDSTPSSLDFSDFGSVELTSNGISHTFTIRNIGSSYLYLTGSPNKITISGANSSDFIVSTSPSSPIAPGGTSTFTITFMPSSIGIRSAVLSIANNDTNENPFTFFLQGLGINTSNIYTVTFDANGGSTPNPTSKQVTLGSIYDLLATTNRTGYNFEGWFTAASGGTQVTTSTIVSNAANHTLYAQWVALPSHIVNFNSNGGSGSMTSQVSNVPVTLTTNDFTHAGYSFSGWNTAANGSGTAYANGAIYPFSADITLYAQWTANNYTVNFDANGGNTPTPTSKQVIFGSTYNTLATTNRTGYTFAGWFTDSSGGTQVTTSTIMTNASNHTLYARWTANNYTVLFESNGGMPYSPASKVFTFGSTYGTLATASRTGYSFVGWFTAANSGTQVTSSTIVSNASNHTLYAQWTALPNHTVIFDANGGTGSMSNQVANSLTTLNINAFTYSGYTFTGWNTVVDGTGNAYANSAPYSFSTDVTLYAQWVDETNPLIHSIVRTSTDAADASSVDFNVTFSEAVQNVDVNDFNLTTTGVTGASITAVSGSGSTRTVTVNTGSGNGTIRLDVPIGASVTDLSSNPLSSLPFETGEVYTVNKTPIRLILPSNGAQDGWVRESSETSEVGGTVDASASVLIVGDDASDRQYRSVLSFDTSSLPDTAVISQATLAIRVNAIQGGGNPLKMFNYFMIDVANGSFGTSALAAQDFQASPTVSAGPLGQTNTGGGWLYIDLKTAKTGINPTGLTQLRLRYSLGDNDNGIENILKFYSGNYATVKHRPQLNVWYSVP